MTTPQFGMAHKFILTAGSTGLGAWTKVSGLAVTWDLAEYRVGNSDSYYKYGGIPKFSKLKLQRALDTTAANATKTWLTEVQTTGGRPSEGSLKMCNSAGRSFFEWKLKELFPSSWSISEFDAGSSKVLVETLELVYGGFFETALRYS
jgi:phage tail-like protein